MITSTDRPIVRITGILRKLMIVGYDEVSDLVFNAIALC